VLSYLIVLHIYNSSLNLLVECNYLSALVLGSDPEKVLVVCGIPATIHPTQIPYLFVDCVHSFLYLCNFRLFLFLLQLFGVKSVRDRSRSQMLPRLLLVDASFISACLRFELF